MAKPEIALPNIETTLPRVIIVKSLVHNLFAMGQMIAYKLNKSKIC